VEDADDMIRCVIDDDGVGACAFSKYKRKKRHHQNFHGQRDGGAELNLLNNLYGTNYSVHYTISKTQTALPRHTV